MGEPGTDRRDGPGRYEIRVQGHLADRWSQQLDGLSLTREPDGSTVLAGPVADQAALHGLLQSIRDLGLPLLSVTPEAPERPDSPTAPTSTGSPS